jgi:peptide/nickel transport system permease protein
MAVTEATAGAPSALADDSTPVHSRAWRRRLDIALPAGLLVLVFGACFLLPLVAPIPKPIGGDILESGLPPLSPGHLLGTDPNGNDILSRILYGGRSSLIVALSVNLLGLIVGGGLGALSAQFGGRVDSGIMRVLDVFIAFPSLVLTLAVAQSLGPSQRNTILALAFFSIPAFARISRSAVLRLRDQPFMVAAKLSGTSTGRIVARHLAPNIGPQLMTFAMLGMGIVMVIEGALSFLGLGIPAPAPSWGNMIAMGQLSMSATPLLVVWPSLMLFLTVIGFNQLGEALRARWSGR